ncbi:MAG: ribosome silencing factor [Candidatus Fournierella pullistercoris]|uniref:Ribosomal silencing factor RsfS n=1 Tax=Candidatus Allofournierella pullistercoris TaxID=2838597 RepID=A0A948T1S1_9FIRM|nr:ribosome silencing factor [Candidatus Fournierella pullistercoris]
MESLQLATSIAKMLDNKKAADVKVLKVEDLTVLTDYFVIANGTSTTHVKSLAEEVEFQMEQQGVQPLRTEGYDSKNWILLDYGSVIVHVFYPQAREFYDLEHLWADAQECPVSFEAEAE